jgi:Kef-type K+ transport system membrane component KefB
VPTENEKELFNAVHDAKEAKESANAAGGCLALSVVLAGIAAFVWFFLKLDWGKYLFGVAAISLVVGFIILNSSNKIKDKYK